MTPADPLYLYRRGGPLWRQRVGEELYARAYQRGLSAAAVAQLAHVSVSAVWGAWAGRPTPHLAAIASALYGEETEDRLAAATCERWEVTL